MLGNRGADWGIIWHMITLKPFEWLVYFIFYFIFLFTFYSARPTWKIVDYIAHNNKPILLFCQPGIRLLLWLLLNMWAPPMLLLLLKKDDSSCCCWCCCWVRFQLSLLGMLLLLLFPGTYLPSIRILLISCDNIVSFEASPPGEWNEILVIHKTHYGFCFFFRF